LSKDTVGKIIQYLIAQSKLEWILPYTIEEYLEGKDVYNINYVKDYKESISEVSGWQIKKFADKLKDIVCLLIGCNREQLEDPIFKETELGEEWDKLQVRYSDGFDEVEEIFPINFNFNTLLDAKGRIAYIHSKHTIKLTPRLLLQLLGTDCMRNIIHPNIHINALFADYKFTDLAVAKYRNPGFSIKYFTGNPNPNWIITDLRFPNELEAIKSRGGITIRVNRPCEECGVLGGHKMVAHKNKPSTHESEISLDESEFDYEIDNSGTVEDLIQKVKVILEKENII
jgi:hypothetical protein